ncbi:hypothetical protein Tco_0266804 [Tanacetum coccineum]
MVCLTTAKFYLCGKTFSGGKENTKDDRGRGKEVQNDLFCGKEGILPIVCRSKQEKSCLSRSDVSDTHTKSINVMVQDTPVEETIFMAIEEDDESDNEQEEEDNQFSHYTFMFHPGPPTKIAEMVQAVGSWKPNKELPAKSKECEHEWKENTVTNYTIYYYCGILTTDMSRLNCPKCQLTTCALCARNYLGKTVNVKGKQPQKPKEEKDFNSNEVKLLKELLKEKKEQVQQMIRDQAKEYYKTKIVELEVSEEEFLEINESIYLQTKKEVGIPRNPHSTHPLDRLKQQGYIGEEPLKHWKKNGELCKLDIINLDITIEDRPLKHVTPAMEDLFRKHVDSLLKIGAIRPSKSRHRKMVMIINSGTTIDPVTGREVKGKERMCRIPINTYTSYNTTRIELEKR